MQLLRARDAVMRRFRPYLRKQRLTDQQGRILRVLAEAGELEMSELAEQTSIHPASLSRIVPRLHAKGILRRSKVDTDARRVIVSITKRGRAAVVPVMRASQRIYEELAAELGPDRLKELHRSLDMLINPPERRSASGEAAVAVRKRSGNGSASAYTPSE
ncbi:MAG TPA: homoprotocatechuate degradation operon regulator HpaR [Stellaceae bacterium]|nr:homoprotocatechuate degradation operon regulator HpaR [Stellaceae bacterium]